MEIPQSVLGRAPYQSSILSASVLGHEFTLMEHLIQMERYDILTEFYLLRDYFDFLVGNLSKEA